jgi:hypothetical protein
LLSLPALSLSEFSLELEEEDILGKDILREEEDIWIGFCWLAPAIVMPWLWLRIRVARKVLCLCERARVEECCSHYLLCQLLACTRSSAVIVESLVAEAIAEAVVYILELIELMLITLLYYRFKYIIPPSDLSTGLFE